MLYGNLELGGENATKCPDQYNDAATLICPSSRRLQLQIFNQRVFVQLGRMPQGVGVGKGAVVWYPEEPWTPVVTSLSRQFDAVRVRNREAGKEAEVFVSVA